MTQENSSTFKANQSTLYRYQVLNQIAEQGLDRLLIFAKSVLQIPIAIIGLLDQEKQWIQTILGLPEQEVKSFFLPCGYALLQKKVFIIDDMSQETQFQEEPLVKEGFRFFAGGPLLGREEKSFGVLCLFDRVPRQLEQKQQDLLQNLLVEIAAQLELKQEIQELRIKHRSHLSQLELCEGILRGASTLSIIGTDLKGSIRSFNGGAEKMLGYQPKEIIGNGNLLQFHFKKELEDYRCTLPAAHKELSLFEALSLRARKGNVEEREWRYCRKDQSSFPALLSLTGLQSEEGKLTGFVAIVQDLTEQKLLEQMKNEFISVVSHELRTPLTSIQGSIRLLLGEVVEKLPESIRELLQIAESNSERLLRLVNEILDVEKLASNSMQFVYKPCELSQVIEQAILTNETYGKQFQVSFVKEQIQTVWVHADQDRLLQALTNLLSNAAKFSPPEKEVKIGLSISSGKAKIWVKDQGPGIPEEFQKHVFERFMQAKPNVLHGGTGLGLNITRSIIKKHGGSIHFDTQAGKGSTFYFYLPTIKPPSE